MNINSCSKLEQNYTPAEVDNLVQAAAMYRKATNDAIMALGTPDSKAANQIAAIAAINFDRALKPFTHNIPEFLRHG